MKKLLVGAIAVALIGGGTYAGGVLYTKSKFEELAQKEGAKLKEANIISDISTPKSTGLFGDKYTLSYKGVDGQTLVLYIDNCYGLGSVTSKFAFSDDSLKIIDERINAKYSDVISYILEHVVSKYSVLTDEYSLNMDFASKKLESGTTLSDGHFSIVLKGVNDPNNVDYTFDGAIGSIVMDKYSFSDLKIFSNSDNNGFSLKNATYNDSDVSFKIDNLTNSYSAKIIPNSKTVNLGADLSFDGLAVTAEGVKLEIGKTNLDLALQNLDIAGAIAKCPNIDQNSETEIRYCLSSVLGDKNNQGELINKALFKKTMASVKFDSEISGGAIHKKFITDFADMGEDASISFDEKLEIAYGNGQLTIDKKVFDNQVLKEFQPFFIQYAKYPNASVLEYELEFMNGKFTVNGNQIF